MKSTNLKLLLFVLSLLFSLTAYAESTVSTLLRQKSDPLAGNPKGKITVVEFFDYECSHCANMVSDLGSLIKANSNIRLVFKDYPILSPESELAARAGLAAKMQGKYYEFYHALFSTNGSMNEQTITQIAKSLGLNASKLIKDMNSSTVSAQLKSNFNLGHTLNVNGTPTFFIAKTDAANMEAVETVSGESLTELKSAIQKIS